MGKESLFPVQSQKFEVIKCIEEFVGEKITSLLRPVNECWQPSDFLPDTACEDFPEQHRSLKELSLGLSDDLLIVLVGDMITEEALPSYQTWLNRLKGIADETGESPSPWAQWSRGWTAEENRHGDLLNRYLYLSGRVNMRSVEITIQNLIRHGFDPRAEDDPYQGFVYTTFQERATKISHRNVATIAKKQGEDTLHRICGTIAGDEAAHETAYKFFMSKVFELDPRGAIHAFATMMRKNIAMPGGGMNDGTDHQIFSRYARVAQNIGVYTVSDYADIIRDLVRHWGVEKLKNLSDEDARDQDYLCSLAERYDRLAERLVKRTRESFNWILDRAVPAEQ
jgi:acyl-[acyl-carrier-protein] desaturase